MSFSFDHSKEPTIHYDPLSNRNIFLAPRRADRPNNLLDYQKEDCPFCIENSHLTPDPVEQWPSIESQDWKSRIIPNAYPIVERRQSTQTSDNTDAHIPKRKPCMPLAFTKWSLSHRTTLNRYSTFLLMIG